MKTIKNAKLFGATIIAISIFLMFAFMVVIPQSVSAYAQEENSLIACGLFSDKQIEASGYLYNFDGSPDYIFDGWYAEKECVNKIELSEIIMGIEPITLYVGWKQ